MGLFDSGESWSEKLQKQGQLEYKKRIAEEKRLKKEAKRQQKIAEKRREKTLKLQERSRNEVAELANRHKNKRPDDAPPLRRGVGASNSYNINRGSGQQVSAPTPKLRRF